MPLPLVEIQRLAAKGVSQTEVARLYKVSRQRVCQFAKRNRIKFLIMQGNRLPRPTPKTDSLITRLKADGVKSNSLIHLSSNEILAKYKTSSSTLYRALKRMNCHLINSPYAYVDQKGKPPYKG